MAIASAWTWVVLATLMVLWLPLMGLVFLVTAPFDKGRYHVGLLFRKIGKITALLNPLWDFRTSGRAVPDPRRPYVAVSNHESFADILLISHLPFDMKWLSKAELFRVPVLGWLMSMANDIPVRRGDRRSALDAMRRCRDVLTRKRVSVMIFPEGTRSETSEMLPFKDGAFRLAVDLQVPILPMVVVGTGTALPKHGWRFGRATAEVRVLEPIETAGLTPKEVPALRDRVRDMIGTERAQMQAAHAADR